MSGIDIHSRLYVRFDNGNSGNIAASTDPDIVYGDYPYVSVGQHSGFYPTEVEGAFDGVGFNIYSYEPTMVPTRTMSYWWIEDRYNSNAPAGLYALYYGDYTIDFWVKVNHSLPDTQPIFGNASGWAIYYKDGVLYQQQGTNLSVSCSCDLTGSFHHVEFNRSGGVNRIFIDGILQELSSNLWNPVATNLYSFYLGCTYFYHRNVDLVVDEIRFSTGIARHTEDFEVPIEAYYRTSWKSNIYFFIQETGTGDIYSGYFDVSIPVPVEFPVTDINIDTNTFTEIGHGLLNGDLVYFNSFPVVPGGLIQGGAYYIVNVSGDTFGLSLTQGGDAVDITSQGSGSITLIMAQSIVTIDTDIRFYEVKKVTGTIYRSGGLDTIRSPIDGAIGFYSNPSLFYQLPFDDTVPATQDGRISISGYPYFQMAVAPDETISAVTDGRIRLDSFVGLQGGVYGLTIPAVQDGEVVLEGSVVIEVDFDTDAIIVGDIDFGTIYDLIENAVEIPAALSIVVSLEGIPSIVPIYTFRFVNAIEFEVSFSLVNVLNFDYVSEFLFLNKLTSRTEMFFIIRNKILPYNEVDKSFTLFNRLLEVPGIPSPEIPSSPMGEQYTGFYFSKIHGA